MVVVIVLRAIMKALPRNPLVEYFSNKNCKNHSVCKSLVGALVTSIILNFHDKHLLTQ